MKMNELRVDLINMEVGDNLHQAEGIYLSLTRKGTPVIVDGPPNSGKEFLINQVFSLFRDEDRLVSSSAVSLSKDYIGDRAKALIISTNTSEEARVNMLRLQSERRTIGGFIRMREEDSIRNKHRQLQRELEDIAVFTPSTWKINTGNGVTLLDQEILLNFIEAIAYLDQKNRRRQEREGLSYIEATEEDFYAAKDILVHTPIFEVHNSLSPEALEFAKDLLFYKDKHPGAVELTRDDFLRACKGKYKTFKPISNKKRLPELIDAGYINIVKKGGFRNGYKYAFSNAFNELDSETLTKNKFSGFSLSSLTSFSSLAKEEIVCI